MNLVTPPHDALRYPLKPRPPEAAITRGREELAAEGMTTFDGFMTPAAVAETLAVARPKFASESFEHRRRHNIYFDDGAKAPSPDHPALARLETANRTLCADQLADTPLMALYRDPDFAAFLAALMEKPALYTMTDPLAAVNMMTYHAGEALNWHFDRSEFTVTILLEAPDEGGAFEYRPGLRRPGDPNFDGVARVLRGEDPEVRSVTLAPGALNVFKGRDTAHRVTPPVGPSPRTIAVLSLYEEPGVAFSAEERIGFYGRA